MPELPKMYPVWVDAENTRVYGIDSDGAGCLWFTGSLPKLHRYDPQTGSIDTIPIPSKHGGSQCLWATDKVHVLPQTNSKITIYHVTEGRVSQVDKPFPEANLWYGQADREWGLLYLPERARPSMVVWDVAEEQGHVHPYPEAGSLPSIREIDWAERLQAFPAPWGTGDVPRRVYFDPESRGFVAEDSEPIPPVRPGIEDQAGRFVVFYRTAEPTGEHTDDARLIRLDRKTGERYERSIPGWNEDFGFIGGGVFYKGWQLNNLSTSRHNFRYDESTGEYIPLEEDPYVGVDGHPYHFMNRFLAYHPESDTFDLLFPDVPEDRYPQLCYNMPVGEHLYITANDIWSAEKGRPLGSIGGPVGQLMVLQSHPIGERA